MADRLTYKISDIIGDVNKFNAKFEGIVSSSVDKPLARVGKELGSSLARVVKEPSVLSNVSRFVTSGLPEVATGLAEDGVKKVLGLDFPIAKTIQGKVDIASEAIQRIENEATSFLQQQFRIVIPGIEKSLGRYISNPILRDVSQKALGQLADKTAEVVVGKVSSSVKTAMMGAARSKAEEIQRRLLNRRKLFLYVGPDDRITRPFCEVLVGYAIPKELLDSLNNYQGLKVKKFGGGYNCRHQLLPISEALVEERGLPIADASLISAANDAARRARFG